MINNKRGQGLMIVWAVLIAFFAGFILATLIAKGIIPISFLSNWMCS